MNPRTQLVISTAMLIASLTLLTYTIGTLYTEPVLCAVMLAWMSLVEYVVGRAWWVDVCAVKQRS